MKVLEKGEEGEREKEEEEEAWRDTLTQHPYSAGTKGICK